jgi:hypothetical protein
MLVHCAAAEAAALLPGYRAVLSWAPKIACHDFGRMASSWAMTSISRRRAQADRGEHQCGRSFLNALLAKAQRACCAEIDVALGKLKAEDSMTRCCACSA